MKQLIFRAMIPVLLLAGLTTPVFGQDRQLSFSELQDKAKRHYARKEWQDAADYYEKLVREVPNDQQLQMRLAECYFELYKSGQGEQKESFRLQAKDQYDKILKQDATNLLAHAHLARLLASQLQPGEDGKLDEVLVEEVKSHLLEAGYYGYRALEALNFYPEFEPIRKETSFQVELITKPKEFQYTAHGSDPFNNPLPRVKTNEEGEETVEIETTEEEQYSDAEQERILKEIEEHINELEAALQNNDFERVSIKWREIEALLATKGGLITESSLRKELKKLQARFSKQTKHLKSLELQHLYSQGRAYIERMKELMNKGELRQVRTEFERLKKHVESMKRKDPSYALPADELIAEAEPVDRKAELLISINQLELRVTGIIDGRYQGREVDKAIINDKILAPGDKVFDSAGKLIKGLIVNTVSSSQKMVRFKYEDIEFSRKLEPISQ